MNPDFVLTTLNAKHAHTSLALRYLAEHARAHAHIDCRIVECNVNQSAMAVLDDILQSNPRFVGFSAYIWNIGETLRLARMVKLVSPGVFIALGGPEVSFDAECLLSSEPAIDLVIRGEGEETLSEVLKLLHGPPCALAEGLPGVLGISFRTPQGTPVSTAEREPICDLGALPNPYRQGYGDVAGRVAYYEASRGCPFSCTYCLSSLSEGVRVFPLDRVKDDMSDMVRAGVLQLRFVDRTFNFDPSRARQIWRHAMAISPKGPPYRTTFHFEIGGSLLTPEDLSLLSVVPQGLFQFEVGVQTTNAQALTAVGRQSCVGELSRAVSGVVEAKRVTVNLDLIAGLPHDTYETVEGSLSHALGLRPSAVHLGFLKALKGSRIRMDSEELGLVFSPDAPYEVLKTQTLSASELGHLRGVEAMVDLYYNSHRFVGCTNLCLHAWDKPGAFFAGLADHWKGLGLQGTNHRLDALLDLLVGYASGTKPELGPALLELARFDRFRLGFCAAGGRSPERSVVEALAPDLGCLPARELSKRAVLCEFEYDVVSIYHGTRAVDTVACAVEPKRVVVLFTYPPPDTCREASRIILVP